MTTDDLDSARAHAETCPGLPTFGPGPAGLVTAFCDTCNHMTGIGSNRAEAGARFFGGLLVSEETAQLPTLLLDAYYSLHQVGQDIHTRVTEEHRKFTAAETRDLQSLYRRAELLARFIDLPAGAPNPEDLV